VRRPLAPAATDCAARTRSSTSGSVWFSTTSASSPDSAADAERGIAIMPASALADLMGGVSLPSDPPEDD